MGQTVHDERYEDIILRALPIEYERVPTARYESRDFGLDDTRHMVHTMYVDSLWHPSNAKLVAGRGIAMQVPEHNGSNVQCTYCKGLGHDLQDCALLKEKEHQRGPRQWGQQVKAAPGGARRRTKQWCSFLRSITHSDSDCRMPHPQQFSNSNGSANYVASCDPNHPISFTAVEGPVEQKAFWPFGPIDDPGDTS